jgi:hypothetical protein
LTVSHASSKLGAGAAGRQALPDIDANSDAVMIERVTLQNAGLERDASVAEPQEPRFTGGNA